MGLTVGEVAALASVSVRTLHHYDRIGLLKPSERSESGYRHYSDGDLVALQQLLFFRELGFSLAEIARIMHDPSFDRLEALRMQHRMLRDKSVQMALMAEAVETAIDATRGGARLDANDMFEVFGEFDPKQYEKEVEERWGSADAYKESAKRTARYTKADWQRFEDESDAINAAIVAAMEEGLPADSIEAMDAVECHRRQIDTWFYPCPQTMHCGLAEMYIADPRFTADYEKIREGMAQYVHDAILANAARSK
jgi:DNA-binding transcriptional MerR regulator